MSDLATYTRPTLIEVMTPHCVECRAMQSDLDAVAGEHRESVDLVVLDATKEQDLVASLRVLGTPTLIAVDGGVEVARVAGRRSRSELTDLFAAVAQGRPEAVETTSRGDRIIWTLGGVLLAAAGMFSGPSWIMVGVGLALAGYAALRSVVR